MIQLVGKLRRVTPMQINKKDGSGKRAIVKLMVEHEISRDEGQSDLILDIIDTKCRTIVNRMIINNK